MNDMRKAYKEAIKNFPGVVQQKLEILGESGGILEPDVVQWIMGECGIDIKQLMMQLLPLAALYAQVPVSGFHVGAVARGLGNPGRLYLGANMEFSDQALSFCVHGEQSAFTNAWIHGERGLQALAINAAPCGYCRQFLYELACASELEILLEQKGSKEPGIYTLDDLLPRAFGPGDLGIKSKLMEEQNHHLTLTEIPDDLVAAALKEANASYAPYSRCYAAVALKTSDGEIYCGRYAENAAYNPSMSPLESALAFMNMNRNIYKENSIEDAVLVENSSVISLAGAVQTVLQTVASVPLRIFYAHEDK